MTDSVAAAPRSNRERMRAGDRTSPTTTASVVAVGNPARVVREL